MKLYGYRVALIVFALLAIPMAILVGIIAGPFIAIAWLSQEVSRIKVSL